MEIRGIDVSAWQGKIDWKTVADCIKEEISLLILSFLLRKQ